MTSPVSLRGYDRDQRINIHFRIPYFTRWGQNLVITGAGALLGDWDPSKGQTMRCHHEGQDVLIWEALISLPWQPSYKYKYAVVQHSEGLMKVDKLDQQERIVTLPEGLNSGDVVEVMDVWVDPSHPSSILSSAAFKKVIRCIPPPVISQTLLHRQCPLLGEAIVRFKVTECAVQVGQVIVVCGSIPGLGNWREHEAMELSAAGTYSWEGELRLPYAQFPFTYKYAVRTVTGADGTPPLEVEIGEQRMMKLPLAGNSQMGAPALIVCDDGHLRRDKQWRGAGLALPVFSIRTRDSVGVGEFLDMIKLIDLAHACGLHLIQVLPINDTSVHNMWWDSYPYSSLSVIALHPQYLALRALRDEMPFEIQAEIDSARSRLEGIQVDYEGVMGNKLRIARMLFDRFGHETVESKAFKEWFISNRDWLEPYAVFRYLSSLFGTADHTKWGALSAPASSETISRLASPSSEHYRALRFTYYLQYHLHLQLLQVSKYAETKSVVLKGDIPIGVDKRSVDTWMDPHLFRMDKSTGAPPDVFDPKGQNWGFPTYNWEEMAKDKYSWWQRRLKHMAQYFTAYRIDHVLGFFRIWEIPGDCTTGILGYFRPSLPISRSELEARGIWDVQRLTQPYIRWHVLRELFGKMTEEVAARYLEETSPGVFKLRPQYSTERQIMDIKVRPDSPQWLVEETEKTRLGLMKLKQNVVLLPDPADPENNFFPRFSLSSTTSFKELPQTWREALAWMHDDYLFGRQDNLWRDSALKKLPTLMECTDMLVCGEDLGFVPGCLPPIMHELGLLGLRIQRMATEPGKEFDNPANYPYLTVASPSCHDIQPIRAWYEADPQRRERFYYEMLCGEGPVPDRCNPEVVRIVVQQHLSSPSVWAIFPIQDLLALSNAYNQRPAVEEVINDPTVAKHYWRYRMHVAVEELQEDAGWVSLIKGMLVDSSRV
ncbi:hypothetical protein CEUSTIGMA_g6935.t1 [Chlamydomonas eustigma]|uniref:4-alpha-glucanotransferase n=1 Tax=Chlamydomonas eustigma TaxID=1157962 RepID=A0A250X8U1_9CHLO|nr:hypothetical protein CEUSTIGMA_g6935.t1 [Chlamydomonas eustigma]|eukprot:GAX79494.1 hypothetical protein CEUSTIGMA_g6935.t1 [Chlamydomonas eustigma]